MPLNVEIDAAVPTHSAAGKARIGSHYPDDLWAVRGPLGRHLIGRGIDVGPGHAPFPIPYPGVRTVLVDRWRPDENRRLFPEFAGADFPEPDVVCDVAETCLDAFGSETMDFVVASHVIEHVPNPLGLLDSIHRVLRKGGVLILLVPDRRFMFDRARPSTSLEHIVSDFDNATTMVDDGHMEDFLVLEGIDVRSLTPQEKDREFSIHRARSIHVHCWTPPDFNELLGYAIDNLGHRWDLVEALLSGDGGPEGIEFGYVLRKSEIDLDNQSRSRRFFMCWDDLRTHRSEVLASIGDASARTGAGQGSDSVKRGYAARPKLAVLDVLRHRVQRSSLYPTLQEIKSRARMSSRVAVDPAPEQPQKSVAPPDLFCREFPSPKTAVDIFAGEWATRFPPPLQDLTGGQHDPIDDGRIRWGAERFGGVGGMRVLELGPLEGAHTYTLDRLGAREVVAVEANQRAFLRCLVAKEILGIPSARFLCGDFVKLLEGGPPSDGRWDLCVAVGVLYHQQDPVKLLDLITRSSDRVLLWTHYYDDAAMSSRPELKARYVPLPATTGGFNYTLHRQYYGESVQQKGFCGGIEVWSGWMERDEILACLEHFNFEVLSVEFDEPNHQNGPAFCVAARRSGIRDDEAS